LQTDCFGFEVKPKGDQLPGKALIGSRHFVEQSDRQPRELGLSEPVTRVDSWGLVDVPNSTFKSAADI
jgi:hypothetical protein